MIGITQDDINELPIHDSDVNSILFIQEITGEYNIIIKLSLYEGEYEDIYKYKNMISANGDMHILCKDCININFVTFNGISQKESIDFINVDYIPSSLHFKNHVEMLMHSGAKLSFDTNYIGIISPTKQTPGFLKKVNEFHNKSK